MNYISYNKIISKLKSIEEGDMVYLVSDIFNLIKSTQENHEKFVPDIFLDTIIEKLGDTGTLLVPTFNWDFCKGITFDYRFTKGKTGAMGNAALKNKKFARTKHPIYSFAVIGKWEKELCEMDPENSFGKDSVFDFMYKKGAKALIIDLPAMSGLTFLHHVEQMVGVPFRFNKAFTADYIDKEGVKTTKTYSMYVRNMEMNAIENTQGLNKIMDMLGVCQTQIINGIVFRTVYLKELMELIRMDIMYNDCKNIYIYNGQNNSL